MSHFFLDREGAAAIEPLARLQAIDSPSITAFEEPFRELIHSDALKQLALDTLRRRDELSNQMSASSSDNHWRLMVTDRFSLSLRTEPTISSSQDRLTTPAARAVRKFLVALPNDFLYGVIGSGGITAQLYRSALPRGKDVFSRTHRLEPVATRRIAPGEVILLRAGDDVINFVAVERGAVLVELALVQADKIVWNYHAETLQAAFASSASVDATRAELAIELFQIFNYTEAVPNLVRIAKEHGYHWVRWKAVKAVLHLDLEQGIAALRAAVDDPHEHVRNAAQATLRNLTEAKLAPLGV